MSRRLMELKVTNYTLKWKKIKNVEVIVIIDKII